MNENNLPMTFNVFSGSDVNLIGFRLNKSMIAKVFDTDIFYKMIFLSKQNSLKVVIIDVRKIINMLSTFYSFFLAHRSEYRLLVVFRNSAD